MVVQHNLPASNASRMYNITGSDISKSSEKLSSGYKINVAADDAAGLAISEKMRRQIRGLDRGLENVQDGISFCQIADGALNEVNDMLNRMKELSIQSANGTNSPSDREAIDKEVQKLKEEAERIFMTTTYNEKQIWERNPVMETITRTHNYTPISFGYGYPSDAKLTSENALIWPDYPKNGFHLSAGTSGLKITWVGGNGTNYSSKEIPWPTPEYAGQSITLSDYLTDEDRANPAFAGVNCKIYYNTSSYTNLDEIKDYFKQVNLRAFMGKNSRLQLQNDTGAPLGDDKMSASISLSSTAIQHTNVNLNGYADTDFASFETMTPIDATSSTDTTKALTFTYTFKNRNSSGSDITVTATAESFTLSKHLSSLDPVDRVSKDDEILNIRTPHKRDALENFSSDGWWGQMATFENGRFKEFTNRVLNYSESSSSFTANSINNELISSSNSGRGALLNDKNGVNDAVTLQLKFKLTSDSGEDYGYMYLNVNGFEHDGADYFLDKIRSIKQVDVFSNSGADNEGSDTAGSADKGTISFSLNRIDVPTSSIDITEPELTGYEDINKNIHSGPDADMAVKLGINYKCLSNFTIGLDKIDVLTEKSSMEAMGLIDEAAKFVVAQRSVFGAYQNRLEHTVKNLGNVVENTQSAESRIRDTDMASEMVNISKGRILAQAGEAMLSQANTSTEGVMSLLQ